MVRFDYGPALFRLVRFFQLYSPHLDNDVNDNHYEDDDDLNDDLDDDENEHEPISGVSSELDSLNCAYIASTCHRKLSCQSSYMYDDDDDDCYDNDDNDDTDDFMIFYGHLLPFMHLVE